MLQNAGVSFAEKVAFSGIMIIFSVILTAMLGFFIGIPLRPIQPATAACRFALIAFLRDRQLFYAILLHTGILIIWALLCALVYDTSFDGMSYQKQAVITLKEGWNPVYEKLSDTESFLRLSGHVGLARQLPKGALAVFGLYLRADKPARNGKSH